jgi:hypothetical protein
VSAGAAGARRVAAFAGALALAAAAACAEAGTDPSTALSLVFDTLPAPAVVKGDTLRDSLGRAVKLSARAYNAKDQLIVDAPVQFLVLDPAFARVTGDGYLIGDSITTTGARVLASVTGLQTPPQLVRVTFVPTSAERARSDTTGSLLYLPLPTELFTSDSLAVRVRGTNPTTGADTLVHYWVVRYQIVDPVIPEGDTTVYLAEEGSQRRARADTTDTRGLASVRLALRFSAVGTLVQENGTVTVEARASYRGQDVAGSPIRFVVHVARRP